MHESSLVYLTIGSIHMKEIIDFYKLFSCRFYNSFVNEIKKTYIFDVIKKIDKILLSRFTGSNH